MSATPLSDALLGRLRTARAFFSEIDGQLRFRSRFVTYQSNLIVARGNDETSAILSANLGHITNKIWNVVAIADRIAWVHGRALAGELDVGGWLMYGALDLVQFHTELRALFDYMAKCIRAAAKHRGSVSEKSFRKLREWVKTPANRAVLGEDLACHLDQARFFDLVRQIRDESLHRGGRIVSYPTREASEGILFQAYTAGLRHELVKLPGVMFNENLVSFKPYAAILFADTLVYLDELVPLLELRVSSSALGSASAYQTGAYETVVVWIDALLERPGAPA